MSKDTQTQQQKDVELVKRVFGGDEQLLKSIRSLMLGLPTTEQEKQEIKGLFADNEVYRVFAYRFYPTLDANAPLGTMTDTWQDVTTMIFDRMPSTIKQAVEYKYLALEMTQKALELVRNPHGEAPDVRYTPSLHADDELQVFLLARNQFIKHVDTQLAFLYVIASSDDKEKAAEIVKRLSVNSAR